MKMKMEVDEMRLLRVLMYLYPDTFSWAFIELSVWCMVVLWGHWQHSSCARGTGKLHWNAAWYNAINSVYKKQI